MSAIGPGDWVECIRADYADDGTCVVLGRLYQVSAVADGGPCRFSCNSTEVIDLVGQAVCSESGWCPCQFRPIYRPRADFIESLKQPSPAREFEDA